MKIYNKSCFVLGIICLFPLPLFAFGIIKADLAEWLITLGFSVKFLEIGLSRAEYERQKRIIRNYGKLAIIKINLPWLIGGSFVAVASLIMGVFDIIIPAWILVCFLIIFIVSFYYSNRLNRKITEHIDKETNE